MANKYVSMMPSGTNNYLSPAETANRTITDFWTPGVSGNTTSTAGVAPASGSFAVNAQGTPNMTVAVSIGYGLVRATPTGANAQTFNVRSDASENVTVSSNASGSTVYDFLYIKLDADKLNNPSVTGTDVFTYVIQRSTTQYVDSNSAPANSELLAEITVTNGAASIGNSSIADRRRKASILFDGWIDFGETPSYASATTMTVSTGLAATLAIGDKLLLRQSGSDKYFYVTGISSTTITINGGTDYTLANATIGRAAYSKGTSPIGFPQWFNYAGAATGFSALTTTVYRFNVVGRRVTLSAAVSGTSNSTGFGMSAPITSANVASLGFWGSAIVLATDNGSSLSAAGRAYLATNATAMVLGKAPNNDSWTGSGTKAATFTFDYEI